MQSTFKKTRKKIILWLFEHSQTIYTKWFKKKVQAWNISKAELMAFPKNTFGKKLGEFLIQNNFEILPKLERHDCYHVLTNYKTEVQDEIALQYLCFGNGKRSVYLFGVIFLGTLLLPDYYKYYLKSYKKGKQANVFYNFDFKKMLLLDFETIQTIIF